MQDLLNYIDIIVLLIVGVFLFFTLRKMLGKKVGYTRVQTSETSLGGKIEHKIENNEDKINANIDSTVYPEGSLAYNLSLISKSDNSFKAKVFIENSKKAFNLILNSFAKGTLNEIKPYISSDIYNTFNEAIDNRNLNNQKLFIEVKEFIMSDFEEAEIKDNIAKIKMKFITMQVRENYEDIYDINNNNKGKSFSEYWTFEKNLSQNTSIWVLVKTSKY